MICIYNKEKDDIPFDVIAGDYVHFSDNNGIEYIISNISSILIDNTWKRAPLSFGETISKRDSTSWIHPDNHSKGNEIINNMKKNWIDSFYKKGKYDE